MRVEGKGLLRETTGINNNIGLYTQGRKELLYYMKI
jgi:hypothetical protein